MAVTRDGSVPAPRRGVPAWAALACAALLLSVLAALVRPAAAAAATGAATATVPVAVELPGAGTETVWLSMVPVSTDAPQPADVAVACRGGAGEGAFTVSFDAPGTYRYTVAPAGPVPGRVVGPDAWDVTVQVLRCADGRLDAAVSIERPGGGPKFDCARFTSADGGGIALSTRPSSTVPALGDDGASPPALLPCTVSALLATVLVGLDGRPSRRRPRFEGHGSSHRVKRC